jgi:hypothetical protein
MASTLSHKGAKLSSNIRVALLESRRAPSSVVVDNLPAYGTHAWFHAQPVNHLFEQRVIAIRHDQPGLYLDLVAAINILTVKGLKDYSGAADPI